MMRKLCAHCGTGRMSREVESLGRGWHWDRLNCGHNEEPTEEELETVKQAILKRVRLDGSAHPPSDGVQPDNSAETATGNGAEPVDTEQEVDTSTKKRRSGHKINREELLAIGIDAYCDKYGLVSRGRTNIANYYRKWGGTELYVPLSERNLQPKRPYRRTRREYKPEDTETNEAGMDGTHPVTLLADTIRQQSTVPRADFIRLCDRFSELCDTVSRTINEITATLAPKTEVKS